jgi:hypothetical protein
MHFNLRESGISIVTFKKHEDHYQSIWTHTNLLKNYMNRGREGQK